MTRIGIVIAILGALGLAESPGVRAQSGAGASTAAAVEVTVWRSIADPAQLYVSTRPEGSHWQTLDTPLDLSRRSDSGRFHQSNAVRVTVPLGHGATATVEVTVWRSIADPTRLYVSTRPENGRWQTLDTPLDLSRRSDSGRFHQSNAVRVAVLVPPPPSPDFVVDTPMVSASRSMAGQTFELAVTVRNRGTGAAAETTLIYYRSDDATLTAGDTEVGRDWVAGLDASSGTSEESLRTQAPTPPGAYYYGACVDTVAGEADPTNNCSAAVAVPVAEFNLQKLPWVADGVTPNERRALDRIRYLAQVDSSMSSQRVAGSPWLADGVTEDEVSLISHLGFLAETDPELAGQLTTVPDRTGHLLEGALRSVQVIQNSDPGIYGGPARVEQLQQQAWFRDGLTEEEAALIVALGSIPHAEDVLDDLLRGGQVRSETIVLPLAGAVDLYAVGRASGPLAGQLEWMRFAAASMEAVMGTPWPQRATIVLVELQSDLGSYADVGGWNTGDVVVVKHAAKDLTYHELAHFYFGSTGARTPLWLTEGAANFLEHHTLRLTGEAGSVSALYARDQGLIARLCAPDGAATIQGWIETGAGHWICPYWLGHQLLAGLHRTLGPAVVWAALRELVETDLGTGRTTTEDAIYQTFLTHVPPAQRDTFRLWYSCLHGRPIPGYAPPPLPSAGPESREALAALYDATNGPGWTNNANWLSEASLDQWYGVSVDCDGSVTGLSLYENQLQGSIPSELGRLTNLTGLNLGNNDLTGPIPPALGGLAQLRELNLLGNQLSGPIPSELGRLTHLTDLDFRSNQLSGPIPPALSRLTHLTGLRLSFNQLTGPIPPELGRLVFLDQLYLHGNQLTGPIPPELSRLIRLTALGLSGNQLTGPIPPDLSNLTQLTSLGLSGNQLTGPIPPELGRLIRLTALRLSENQLHGPIPPELSGLVNLTLLGLSNNQLSGPIPPALGRFARLTYLSLAGNQLHGPIPPALGNLATLEKLILSRNQLTGQIPTWLGSLANLTTLDLAGNQLHGPIPPALGNLATLEKLHLSRNQLTGQIPTWLGSLANLRQLILSENQLSGPIPPTLGNLSHLTWLYLRRNQLHGPIPPALGRLANLTRLYLAGNQLTGCVPQALVAVEINDIDSLRLAICEDS